MEHVVFYPSAEGLPSFRRVGSLDEAVNFVEHLRNVEGITEFSVHALTSVPLAFRAYYRVEVPPGEEQVPVQSPSPASTPVPAEAAVAPSEQPYSWRTEPETASATASAPAPDAGGDDRSAQWVAEAAVVEAPVADVPAAPAPVAAAVADAPVDLFAVPATTVTAVPSAPFEAAPPVTTPATGTEADILPEPEVGPAAGGRRSMGFFSR